MDYTRHLLKLLIYVLLLHGQWRNSVRGTRLRFYITRVVVVEIEFDTGMRSSAKSGVFCRFHFSRCENLGRGVMDEARWIIRVVQKGKTAVSWVRSENVWLIVVRKILNCFIICIICKYYLSRFNAINSFTILWAIGKTNDAVLRHVRKWRMPMLKIQLCQSCLHNMHNIKYSGTFDCNL